jgi:predicted RNA-binding Zn-ribbon protein involved in translation (DUF1610 family)
MRRNETVKSDKVSLRSLILEYFTPDIYMGILKISMINDADNNMKGMLVRELLKENNVPFTSLGSGTNRMAVMIDGYAVKIALDKDGMIDNRREMLYTKQLQPYVVKVYECTPNGLIAVTEYVDIFTLDEYRKYQDDMRSILKEISKLFLIGDVGITTNNYVNWGMRNDGTICILDFAYIYSVKFKVFTCTNDDALLQYDNNYVNLRCPECGRVYTFGEIRRRITRKQQEDEIGDIRRVSYNLKKAREEVAVNPEFTPQKKKKDKKKKNTKKQLLKDYRNGLVNQDGTYKSQEQLDDEAAKKNITTMWGKRCDEDGNILEEHHHEKHKEQHQTNHGVKPNRNRNRNRNRRNRNVGGNNR